MKMSEYLEHEWRPALGCTEPGSIAYAASSAASLLDGPVEAVTLVCDGRMYKNCYAVGIPNSDHRVGILWALGLGVLLPDPSAKLEIFEQVTDDIIQKAQALISGNRLSVQVDAERKNLFIEVRVRRGGQWARAVISGDHTRLVRLEQGPDFEAMDYQDGAMERDAIRAELSTMPFSEMIDLAESMTDADRSKLREGMEMNMAISRHGLSLLPDDFLSLPQDDSLSSISRMVCAGVYARMWGEDFPVMTLAGSGNKGITFSVPIFMLEEKDSLEPKQVEQAMAAGCLVTSAATHHLGTLSAVCGASNAAGIGLAVALVRLQGGSTEQISMAINNMVGNVTGMICDGAKIGCALKTMTAVDAAFRAVSLAMSGLAIPVTDGIVGNDGLTSLKYLGRIATSGMASADAEILSIMQEKLSSKPSS